MTLNPETQRLSKAESARMNGTKSQGATTPEGQLRAANGNLKHGAYSSRVVMDGEDPELFALLRSCIVELFKPQDAFESEIVDTLANTRWRIRRLEAAETDGLNAAVFLNKPYVEARFEAIDVAHERALALQADSANLERNTRVEERLHRIYERNYKLLSNYRRKSARSMPETPASALHSTEPLETQTPDLAKETPELKNGTLVQGNEPSVLPDPPNSKPPGGTAAASTISNIAMLLVIFALLLLTPVQGAARKAAFSISQPAIHSSNRLQPASHSFLSLFGVQK